jgi:hypothetical protein
MDFGISTVFCGQASGNGPDESNCMSGNEKFIFHYYLITRYRLCHLEKQGDSWRVGHRILKQQRH